MRKQISFIELIVIAILIAVLISCVNIIKKQKNNITTTKNSMIKQITESKIYGNTPEEKYGNIIYIAHMFVIRIFAKAVVDIKPDDLARAKKIYKESNKQLEDIKNVVHNLQVPAGYEDTHENFLKLINKTQEVIKSLSKAKTEKQRKESQRKIENIAKLSMEFLNELVESGYRPTEAFEKYCQKMFKYNKNLVEKIFNNIVNNRQLFLMKFQNKYIDFLV